MMEKRYKRRCPSSIVSDATTVIVLWYIITFLCSGNSRSNGSAAAFLPPSGITGRGKSMGRSISVTRDFSTHPFNNAARIVTSSITSTRLHWTRTFYFPPVFTRRKNEKEQEKERLKAFRRAERQRNITKYRRWKSYRERTMASMAKCYKLLGCSALLDLIVHAIEKKRRPAWNVDTVWWILDTVWKLSLGIGLWRVHANFKLWGTDFAEMPASYQEDDDDEDKDVDEEDDDDDDDEDKNVDEVLPEENMVVETVEDGVVEMQTTATMSNTTFGTAEDKESLDEGSSDDSAPMSMRDRMQESLTVLAFLWRKTSWFLLVGAVLDLWALLGISKWLGACILSMVGGLFGFRHLHHVQTNMFLVHAKTSSLRHIGLKTVQNMAFCAYALIVQGIVDCVLCLVRSVAVGTNSPSVAFPTTAFWAAALLWDMRRAFFRAVVTNSSSEHDGLVLINQDLLQAQDNFYGTISTAITSEILAKAAWLLVAALRAIINPELLQQLSTRSF